MVITLDDICEEKEKIITKHPNLKGVTIKSMNEHPIENQELSEFIESTWKKDYQNEARLLFTQDFLEYNDQNIDKECSILLFDQKTLTGCFLSYKKNYLMDETISTAHNTALTVRKDNSRGKGNGQLLWLEQMRRAHEKGYDATTYWLDSRHKQKGQSFNIFGNNSITAERNIPISIVGKPLCIERSCSYGNLNYGQKIGIKTINSFFETLPSKIDFEIDSEIDEKTIDFLLGLEKTSYFPNFDQIMLETKKYNSKNLNGVCFNFRKNKEVLGVIYGFTIPVNSQDSYFQADGIYLKKDLNWRTKKGIIKKTQEKITTEYDCFSILLPNNCTNHSLLTYGFIPIETQNLVVNPFRELDTYDLKTELR